jgi:hypothetical protein
MDSDSSSSWDDDRQMERIVFGGGYSENNDIVHSKIKKLEKIYRQDNDKLRSKIEQLEQMYRQDNDKLCSKIEQLEKSVKNLEIMMQIYSK